MLFCLLAAVLLGPVLWHFNSWLYGIGGDGVGAPYGIAERASSLARGGLFAPLRPLLGAPFPYPDTGGSADPLWWYAGVAIDRILNPIGASNALVLLGFSATAIATYTLLRSCRLSAGPAALGGLIYGFCPIRLAQAQEHFLLLDGFWLAAECALLLILTERRLWQWSLALGICIGLTEIDNPYLSYFGAILAGSWFVSLSLLLLFAHRWSDMKSLAVSMAVALGGLLIVVLPSQVQLFLLPSSSTELGLGASSLLHDVSELDHLSLRWWNFFLPFPDNPILGPLGRGVFYTNLGTATVTEQSTTVGFTALFLASVGMIADIRQVLSRRDFAKGSRRKVIVSSNEDVRARSPAMSSTIRLLFIAVLCILSGIGFGVPPQVQIGHIDIATPSYFAHALFPEIRTISRSDLLIQFGVAILAALGVQRLAGLLRSALSRRLLVLVLALLVLLEYSNVPPWRYVALLPAPPVFVWLQSISEVDAGILAEYPLAQSDLAQTPVYAFYAYAVHHHPLFNGVRKGTPPDALRRNFSDVLNPTNPASWAALGVKTVTIDRGYYRDLFGQAGLAWEGGLEQQLPSAYHLDYQDTSAKGYSVVSAPARLLVGMPEQYGDADLRGDGRVWQRIGGTEQLWLDNVTQQPVQAVVFTQAHNNTSAHSIAWPGYAPVPISMAHDASPVAIAISAVPGMHAQHLQVQGVARPMPGTGNPTLVSVELRGLEPAPVRPLAADFTQGGQVRWRLSGVSTDACTIQAGTSLEVALLWQVLAPTAGDQTVFLHLVAPDGTLAAQDDGLPDGKSMATSRSSPDQQVSDAREVALPPTLPPGQYRLQAGLYDAASGDRLPLASGGDTVDLGAVSVIPPSSGPARVPCPW